MPILQSCYCCCSSAKQLAIAGGIFSLVVSSVTMADFLYPKTTAKHHSSSITEYSSVRNVNGSSQLKKRIVEEDATLQYVGSVINPKGFAPEDLLYLNLIKFCCDIMVLTSIPPLFMGIFKKHKQHLLPWIVANSLQSSAILIEAIYLLRLRTTRFEPVTAFIFTATFFLLSARVYSILGVISLYQEFEDEDAELITANVLELRPILKSMGPKVDGSGAEKDHRPGSVPRVLVNYGDDFEREESVLNETLDPQCRHGSRKVQVADKGKLCRANGHSYHKKGEMVQPVTPLEVIEEASGELSQSEHSTIQQERSNSSTKGLLDTPSYNSINGDRMTADSYQESELKKGASERFTPKNTPNVEENPSEAIATAKNFFIPRRFVRDSPPDSRHKASML